jgi:ABC-2 type transport system ATP-binding protein
MTPAIEVNKLSKKYKNGTEAVKGVDFLVKKGEVFAFLGPNGAGKTTTVEILEGLRNKTSGKIYYFGKKIETVNREIKEKIGVVLQKTEVMELLTVKETIKLFSSFYKKSVPYKKIIATINLEEKENSRIKG